MLDLCQEERIHTAEPSVSESRCSEAETATEKLKWYKFPGTNQIPAELIETEGKILHSEIHILINSVLNQEQLPQQWKESIIVPICNNGNKTDCNNYTGISVINHIQTFI